jgi:Domain of unknown function (DUF3821)
MARIFITLLTYQEQIQSAGDVFMIHGPKILLIAVLVTGVFLVSPVVAALNTIPMGGTAFIGEQGLDITATGAKSGSSIAWFTGSANVATGAPAAVVTVDDPSNFYVAPLSFSGKTGQWYLFPEKTLAFYVEDPSLSVRIYDDTSQFEVSGTVTWVPKGDVVSFTIESDLYKMAYRPGVTGAPVTIRVRSPDGTEYTQLSGNSLADIMVNSASYSTGPIWSTGSYTSGTYTVWAECNANGMKDNYPVVPKTISAQKQMLLQNVNPLITSSVTPTTTKPPAPVVTNTEPGTSIATQTLTPASTVPTPSITPVATSTIPATEIPVSAIPPTATTIPGPGIFLVSAGIAGALFFTRRGGPR